MDLKTTKDIVQALVIDETITPMEALLLSRREEFWFYIHDDGIIATFDKTRINASAAEVKSIRTKFSFRLTEVLKEDFEIIAEI